MGIDLLIKRDENNDLLSLNLSEPPNLFSVKYFKFNTEFFYNPFHI